MKFYVGMDDIAHVRFLPRTFISINRLRQRKSDFRVNEWIMDSGAFTEISTHGRWTTTVEAYASMIERWRHCGRMLAAVAQDMMWSFHARKNGRSAHDWREAERFVAKIEREQVCMEDFELVAGSVLI